MAVPKVIGVETEYGVTMRGAPDPNPVTSSSLLINAYVDRRGTGWDFEDESPDRDARGYSRGDARAPEIETHLVNAVLTNGARYYVDHAHPEYSTPECRDPLEAVRYDKAGERILARSMAAARRMLPPDQEIVVYKNNSDGKGNSYGRHENYLVGRDVPFGALVRTLLPWFVTRQVFTGAGKVGSENGADAVDFQLSQRADFFEEEVGLETTLKRPIVNTRDEPHADPQRYRRLHVIAGDANLCEEATYLKIGTTAIVLAMIEDGFIRTDLALESAVPAIRAVSHDPGLAATIETTGLGRATALEVQEEFLRLARIWAASADPDPCGGAAVVTDVLDRWEDVIATLGRNPRLLDGRLDWVTKRGLLDAYAARDGLDPGDPKLALLALQYHDVRPERSLYERLVRAGRITRLLGEEEVLAATADPPEGTRAFFRGTCLARWPDSVVAANWDSLVLDVGEEPLRRIPMMEPMRGSKEHVAELLARVTTPGQLVEGLAAG
ncbi:MAG: depupylase/deamidase Dop [Actinomycetota bacterium]